MSDETEAVAEQLPLDTAASLLRRAREQAGLSIAQIASETRIPIRHLEVIEAGDYGALPSRTYAVGFARTFARSVGLDGETIVGMVREELGSHGGHERRQTSFEPGDPARIPSKGLAWASAGAALILIIGMLAFFRGYFIPGSGPAPLEAERPAATAPDARAQPGASLPAPQGAVVFTALENDVWVRFYDGEGTRLLEKQMARGERYTVPAAANNPQIWTGQPEALEVSIGGRSIGRLAPESGIVRDQLVTAAALLARGRAQAQPTTPPATPPAVPSAVPSASGPAAQPLPTPATGQ